MREVIPKRAPTRARHDLAARCARFAARWLWLVPVLAAVELVYVFLASAGTFTIWPPYLSYHDLLAEAFRAGQLHLLIEPRPELLAQPDPYNPIHGRYWMVDLTLYGGKYYPYWGPVPALLQAAAKSLLGIEQLIGDQYLVFAFFSLAALFGALLIDRMQRRLFPSVPRWYVVIAASMLAFAHPVLHLVSTGGTYQASIAGGQAFLLAGLLLTWDALWRERAGARHALLVAAGVCFGLALGCRISLAPAVLLIGVAAGLAISWSSGARLRSLFSSGLSLGAPVALSVFLLLLYNRLRFDDWFEFGTNYQLTYFKFRLSSEYIWPNLYSYLLRPFEASCHFPFVFQLWHMGPQSLPDWIGRPPGYLVNEPVVGWLRTMPSTWLIPLSVLAAPRPFDLRSASTRAYAFCLVAFAIMASVPGFAVMGLYMATMRYMVDVVYGLALLAVLAAFALRAHGLGRAFPRLAGGLFVLPSLATIAMGFMLGYQGYIGHVRFYNPALDDKLRAAFSTCGPAPPPVPKYTVWAPERR